MYHKSLTSRKVRSSSGSLVHLLQLLQVPTRIGLLPVCVACFHMPFFKRSLSHILKPSQKPNRPRTATCMQKGQADDGPEQQKRVGLRVWRWNRVRHLAIMQS